ncbi:bifunctional ADP-dependent NAD(P)H-hydrate dehydratase/NAD(P)H-hydrate epimerase [Streptomyces chumphonensis]|uniref:Bifunctional NAD(P)H-hydrate repair enzyme n=1 Tax=Streptomyces chumphonensis TaxID=1214925 RepID=A0A927F147_9ACTN|nr:NAD(P)H-hydrate dehydratase [Streptomyces chumphonensis]MBD3932421.1 NAD(P)H-hydrate dehydratase [Streptomyces chumphonensis]
MRNAYRVEVVRHAERELMARLPEGALMRRAAAGLAAAAADLLGRVYGTRVALLVGSGDNGGDALYAGARLARRGAGVTAVLLSPDRVHPGGLAALRRAGGRAVGAEEAASGRAVLGGADLVLDGITGIGGRGGLRENAARLLRGVTAPVLAVDLPSGVNADTGEVDGEAVRAAATVTFGAWKPGLLVEPARSHAGAVRLVDIGLAPYLPATPDVVALQHADVAALLPRPGTDTDKYRRGVVGVAAGSARYPGAAVLAVSGALRGGAGAVRYAGTAAAEVLARHPEALVTDGSPEHTGRVQAWAVGSGLGDGAGAERAVREVLDADVPVLIDADGLRLADVDAVRARRAPTVLTPHAGEAAALLDTSRAAVEAGMLDAVRRLADRYRATVLLKGSATLVAGPDGGPVRANPTGTGWLATAGSGDVLSGLIGALLAAGLDARDAAAAGAHLHGVAGRTAPAPPAASDVAAALPAAWREVCAARPRRA